MNATLKFNRESLEDSLTEAVAKTVFRRLEPTDAEIATWVRINHDRIVSDMEDALLGVCDRIANPPVAPERPVLSFNDGKIRLWVCDAHQRVKLADHRSFQFGGDETASLIYEERSHGHRANEVHINDESIWKWIQKYMALGMAAEAQAAKPVVQPVN